MSFSLLLVLLPFFVKAQIINTVAGTGSSSYHVNGGLADTSSIGQPYACAVDSRGNCYFSSTGGSAGSRVSKVTPCGVITTFAGIGSSGYNGDGILATTAKLSNPIGLAFDSLDNLFIADEENNRIRKVDAITGIITTVAGNGIAGSAGDGMLANTANLNQPGNICFDRLGNLYIVDGENKKIRKVNTDGIISTIAGTGISGYTGDNGPADTAEIENLYGISTDTVGNIYFTQFASAVVRKIDTEGIITTIAGDGSAVVSGDGGPALLAGLSAFGLTHDRFGNLFISGYLDNDVRKINDSGVIYTVAGRGGSGFSGDGGPADSALLYGAFGIAVDYYGNLYISDCGNSRIRKVTFHPVITPTITVTIAANTGDTICGGAPVIYTASVSGAGTTSFSYQWLVNGNPVADTTSTYTYVPANGDSVRCVLSAAGICYTPGSNEINMVVAPVATPTITLSGPATATVGSTVTVTATITGAGSSYDIKWYDNGILFATTTAPMVAYTMTAGTNLITATVLSTSSGCYDTATSAAHSITSANAGIINLGSQSVSLYPNPAHDELLITSSGNISNIIITNILGQNVFSSDYSAPQVQVNVAGLPAGVYFVTINGNEVRKFVKE